MLVKKFVPRALMQHNQQSSIFDELLQVAEELGYFLLNPTFKSTVGNVSTERTQLMNVWFYHQQKMNFREQIIANKITVAIQEALILSKVYDVRGWGNKVNYSYLYGTSFQWVDIPSVKILYKWVDSKIFDMNSCLVLKPSSSQLTLLKSHDFLVSEFNQAVKKVGGLTIMEPIWLDNGDLCYGLQPTGYSTRLNFSTYDKMAVTLSNSHEFNGELKTNPNAIPLANNLILDRPEHILITAQTGMGKTQLALGLSAELGWLGNTIEYYLDPKHSDLATFGKFLGEGRYADTIGSIDALLHKLVQIMKARYKIMSELENMNPSKYVGKSATDYGFSNIVVFFDEISALLSVNKSCLKDLEQLLMLGRQAGIFIVLIMQNPRATNNLPSAVKDQTGVRIALGKLNGTLTSLIFGSGHDLPDVSRDVGEGYIQIDGGDVSLFDAPLMPNNSKELFKLMKLSLKGQALLDPLRY